MTPVAIGHFTKCFSFALNWNKDITSAMSANLRAFVPPFFGQHDNCNKTWCGFHRNAESYKQTVVLKNQNLRHEMEKIMESLLRNIEKIAPCASTRANESLNNMVAQKAPKTRHYCSSSSLKTRVKCAISKKNNSYGYVSQIHRKCGLSIGKLTLKRCQEMEKNRKRVLQYKVSTGFKRMRQEKQGKIAKTEATKELREGMTYQSGWALDCENTMTEETISSLMKVPELKQIELNKQDVTWYSSTSKPLP